MSARSDYGDKFYHNLIEKVICRGLRVMGATLTTSFVPLLGVSKYEKEMHVRLEINNFDCWTNADLSQNVPPLSTERKFKTHS